MQGSVAGGRPQGIAPTAPWGDDCLCGVSCWQRTGALRSPYGMRSHRACPDRDPVAFTNKWIGRQTDPTRQGGDKPRPYGIEELPINAYSSHPYLRYLCEILPLAPDMQQGLSIVIGFKKRCIIAPLLYLSCIHSGRCLAVHELS